MLWHHASMRYGWLWQIDDYWEPSKKSLWGVGTCAFQLLMFGLWSRYPCRFCIAEDSKMLDRLLGWESWKLWRVDMHTLSLHTWSIGYLYVHIVVHFLRDYINYITHFQVQLCKRCSEGYDKDHIPADSLARHSTATWSSYLYHEAPSMWSDKIWCAC